MQLVFGKLYTFYATKWVFLAGVGVFELGSFICGSASTSAELIIGRSIARLGVAVIFTDAILIIATNVPLHERHIYTCTQLLVLRDLCKYSASPSLLWAI